MTDQFADLLNTAVSLLIMPNIGVRDYLGIKTTIILNNFIRMQGKDTIQFMNGWINITSVQKELKL